MTDRSMHVHLVGICGTGMGGLAGLLHAQGYRVTGSDADVYPPMSDALRVLGIPVTLGFGAQTLEGAAPDLVVVGNAVNAEVQAALARRLPVVSFPEALAGHVLTGRQPTVVAGTHGKTTTTALLAWMLRRAGRTPGFLIGGVARNFEAGFALGEEPLFLVEGDEFRSSPWDASPKFLHYRAVRAILHNIEFDHADLYPTLGDVTRAFRDLVAALPADGMLLAGWDCPLVREVAAGARCRVVSYAVSAQADYRASDLQRTDGGTEFTLHHGSAPPARLVVPLHGAHNVRNVLAAAAMAAELGVGIDAIREAAATFEGVRRRQELVAEVAGVAIVDDFAHHPTAVRAALEGVRAAWPGRRLWAVFEPRTFTCRLAQLEPDLAEALSRADRVVVAEPVSLQVVPPDRRLCPRRLVEAIGRRGVQAVLEADVDAVVRRLVAEARGGDVVVLLSPGAFAGLRRRLPDALGARKAADGARRATSGAAGGPAVPEWACLHHAFDAACREAPDRVAVIDGHRHATYAEIERRAALLAHRLMRAGVEPGSRVGVMLPRSADVTVALLAVLEVGAAVVPLDPAYPPAHLERLCRQVDPAAVITRSDQEGRVWEGHWRCVLLDGDQTLDRLPVAPPPAASLGGDDLAFVMPTSGSTGTPRCVMVTHGAVVNRFRWMYRRFPFRAGEITCQRTPIGFVDALWEILGPLGAGVPSVVVPETDAIDADRLVALLARHGVTRIVLVPSLLAALLDQRPDLPARVPTLWQWTLSGEVLPRALVERLGAGRLADQPPMTVLNLYGSTEVAADATCYQVRGDETGPTIPIGEPIDGATVEVLDPLGRPVPDGEPGELYIGGVCVSPGYLGAEALTRERFVPDTHGQRADARLFRSGDLVRRIGDRGLEYLGRIDDQIKIRGVRIEPGEIEAVLLSHPGVRSATVVAHEPADAAGARRLVAFVTAGADLAGEAETRRWLGERLPTSHVPDRIVTVQALPRLPGGKVDRRALADAPLPEPGAGRASVAASMDGAAQREAGSLLEAWLASLMALTLRRHEVGATDDFFALGGNSMAAMHLVAIIEAETGVSMPPGRILEAPTARELARRLEAGDASSSIVPLQPRGDLAPLFVFHGLDGDVAMYRGLAVALGEGQPTLGLAASRVHLPDGAGWGIEDLAAVCVRQIRQVQPEGPYHLAGYSAAGTTAFEAARQLRAAGQVVGLLAILDHPAPNSSYASLRGLFSWRGLTTLLGETIPARVGRFLATPRREMLAKLVREARYETWVATGALARMVRGSRRTGRGAPRLAPWFRDMLAAMPERARAQALRHREALARYAPTSYDGRVTLFRVRGPGLFCSQDGDMGWRDLATGGVETIVVPGGHGSMLLQPSVRVLATEIRTRLAPTERRADGAREASAQVPAVSAGLAPPAIGTR